MTCVYHNAAVHPPTTYGAAPSTISAQTAPDRWNDTGDAVNAHLKGREETDVCPFTPVTRPSSTSHKGSLESRKNTTDRALPGRSIPITRFVDMEQPTQLRMSAGE